VQRELIKSIHFHPDWVTLWRSIEMLVSTPRVPERHKCSSGSVNNLAHDTPLLCVQLKLLCREPIKGIGFHPDQTTAWRLRNCCTSVRMIDIGRICLAIRTQNGTEISIYGIEFLYIQVSFEPQQITEYKL